MGLVLLTDFLHECGIKRRQQSLVVSQHGLHERHNRHLSNLQRVYARNGLGFAICALATFHNPRNAVQSDKIHYRG
jgi:hypothetical protein